MEKYLEHEEKVKKTQTEAILDHVCSVNPKQAEFLYEILEPVVGLTNPPKPRKDMVKKTTASTADKDQHLTDLRKQMVTKDKQIAAKDEQIAALLSQLESKDAQTKELITTLQKKDEAVLREKMNQQYWANLDKNLPGTQVPVPGSLYPTPPTDKPSGEPLKQSILKGKPGYVVRIPKSSAEEDEAIETLEVVDKSVPFSSLTQVPVQPPGMSDAEYALIVKRTAALVEAHEQLDSGLPP